METRGGEGSSTGSRGGVLSRPVSSDRVQGGKGTAESGGKETARATSKTTSPCQFFPLLSPAHCSLSKKPTSCCDSWHGARSNSRRFCIKQKVLFSVFSTISALLTSLQRSPRHRTNFVEPPPTPRSESTTEQSQRSGCCHAKTDAKLEGIGDFEFAITAPTALVHRRLRRGRRVVDEAEMEAGDKCGKRCRRRAIAMKQRRPTELEDGKKLGYESRSWRRRG